MSYGFKMFFKANLANLGEAMIFAHTFVQKNKTEKNIAKVINDNSFFIPSLRYLSLDDPEHIKSKFKITDRYWMNQLFSYDFVYWPSYQLLGLPGEEYPNEDMFDQSFYFQNSCDQDYDFDSWKGIPIAETIAKKYEIMSQKGITIDSDEFETKQEKIDYENKSAAYQEVYETLCLDSWLWGKSNPKFDRFSLCMFNSSDELLDAYYKYMEQHKIN